MTLKELAEHLTKLAAIDPYASVFFTKLGTEELTQICYLQKRNKLGPVTPEPSKGTYVVIGQ